MKNKRTLKEREIIPGIFPLIGAKAICSSYQYPRRDLSSLTQLASEFKPILLGEDGK